MKKALYGLIISLISLLFMSYGMTLEQELLPVNGLAVLQVVIPAFTFLLSNIFILMFEKETKPLIIFSTAMSIGLISGLITVGYFNISLEDLGGNQGLLFLILTLLITSALTMIALKLYSLSGSHFAHSKIKG